MANPFTGASLEIPQDSTEVAKSRQQASTLVLAS